MEETKPGSPGDQPIKSDQFPQADQLPHGGRRPPDDDSLRDEQPLEGEGDQPLQHPPSLWRYAGIGAEFFSPIIGGSVAGYYLDDYLHTGSLWTLVGLLGGVLLAFYRLIVELREFLKNS